MAPTPLALKNQLLSGSGDLRSALEVCEKVVEMLKVLVSDALPQGVGAATNPSSNSSAG
jgi:hypothetical protein